MPLSLIYSRKNFWYFHCYSADVAITTNERRRVSKPAILSIYSICFHLFIIVSICFACIEFRPSAVALRNAADLFHSDRDLCSRHPMATCCPISRGQRSTISGSQLSNLHFYNSVIFNFIFRLDCSVAFISVSINCLWNETLMSFFPGFVVAETYHCEIVKLPIEIQFPVNHYSSWIISCWYSNYARAQSEPINKFQ